MRRILTLATLVAIGLGQGASLAAARGSQAKLQLRQTSVGAILVNARGFTLYAFTRDSRNHDACAQMSSCLGAWPALTSSGKPVAGKGVRAGLIGTITLRGGAKQVTYAGHPLYTYVGDSGPGQTFYVNIFQFSGRWPAVNGAGNEIK
jgi:predicted lipoprotein with Yx(FWY)xxD motif